jgi:L-cysteine:1D-myo-inositol 2-amino-2-deoxy-alpha-D-glucopyranoside ligase
VQELLDADVAYESNGNVYFHIDSWPQYGRLCRMDRAEMLTTANERGNNPDDPNKKDPMDFVLWQAQAPDEPAWDSPWGPGRPGWHIECSTMSSQFLGQTIDIHGGGADLLFPHHESEIAQSEPLLDAGECFTRFWMHTAMVYHEGEKMSKSLGNLVMARDLLKTWSPDALRLYLGSYHYRQIWSHDDDALAQAGQLADKLLTAVTAAGGNDKVVDPTPALTAFNKALANDLDTPTATTLLAQLADDILATQNTGQNVQTAQQALRQMGRVFGLRLDNPDPETRVIDGWNEHLQRFE